MPVVGIDTVGGSEGKATEPYIDETVWISMGYAWVTTICRTEILFHSFSFSSLLFSHNLDRTNFSYPLLCKPLRLN